jgi:hypothetical protein
MPDDSSDNKRRKRKVLSDTEREEVVRRLLYVAKGTKLPNNTFSFIALDYGCGFNVVKKIWYMIRVHPGADPDIKANVAMKKKGNCGRKCEFTPTTFA